MKYLPKNVHDEQQNATFNLLNSVVNRFYHCCKVFAMKVKYMLVNKSGKARKIPPFEAWQWTHYLDDEEQLRSLYNALKKTIRDNRLTLANLQVDVQGWELSSRSVQQFAYKGPIIYDETIQPSRIINRHAETMDECLQDEVYAITTHMKLPSMTWFFKNKVSV